MSLSEKINGYDPITQIVVKKDIKEFIKDLKKKYKWRLKDREILLDHLIQDLDKIAGEELAGSHKECRNKK